MKKLDLEKIKIACKSIYYTGNKGQQCLKSPATVLNDCDIFFEDYKVFKWLAQKGLLEDKEQEEAVNLIVKTIQSILSKCEELTMQVNPYTKEPEVQPNAYKKIFERWGTYDVVEVEKLADKLNKNKMLLNQKEKAKKVSSPIIGPKGE